MNNYLFHIVLAICLVSGTWVASHRWPDPQPLGMETATPSIDPAVELDAMDLHTGDSFWGLRLCGVVPCSTLTVKGGGHLVTLSSLKDVDGRCFFHVVGEKRIELHDKTFTLRVIAPDRIHVERDRSHEATAAAR